MRADNAEVVVIGAGWAGLSAAIHLSDSGRRVRLIDAAPQAGGRARSILLNWKRPDQAQDQVPDQVPDPIKLDNGQHLLLGAYTEVLALLRRIGANDADHLTRAPMRLQSSTGLLLARRRFADAIRERWSLLFALASAKGLGVGARWALASVLLRTQSAGWRAPAGVSTVTDWYARTAQPAELIHKIWQPLVISALNTPSESACAATFLRVLRDSLGSAPDASDFILPRSDLSHLFVDPAVAWLRRSGARIALRCEVRRIEAGSSGKHSARYRIFGGARQAGGPLIVECDQIVLATPPYATARLLEGLAWHEILDELKRFEYLPITTAYLGWPGQGTPICGLPAVLSLDPNPSRARFAQWFFDRGHHSDWRIGSLVISDSRAARELGDDRLREALIDQLSEELDLPAPARFSLIHEKRATFACTPDRPRLTTDALTGQLPGIVLAGDYVYSDYPATLEAAVRSGRQAREALDSTR